MAMLNAVGNFYSATRGTNLGTAQACTQGLRNAYDFISYCHLLPPNILPSIFFTSVCQWAWR